VPGRCRMHRADPKARRYVEEGLPHQASVVPSRMMG
jgi:hypothetical protein